MVPSENLIRAQTSRYKAKTSVDINGLVILSIVISLIVPKILCTNYSYKLSITFDLLILLYNCSCTVLFCYHLHIEVHLLCIVKCVYNIVNCVYNKQIIKLDSKISSSHRTYSGTYPKTTSI